MNSNSTFQCKNTSDILIELQEEEFGDNNIDNQKLIAQLNAENEKYKQEIHQLQLKNSSMEILQNDLQETIDSLESSKKQLEISLNLKLNEVEKNKIKINELTTRINELEIISSEEKNQIINLQKQLDEANKKLSTPVVTPLNEVSFKLEVIELEEKVQQLVDQLSDKHNDCFRLEEDLRECHKNLSEFQEFYKNTKEQLAEKNEALEAIRNELTECRIELENLRDSRTDQALKGNSVFAELEDRRQKLLKTLTAYKQGYNDIKISLQIKFNEIKVLKAEKAALLTTLKNDADETIQQNADLIQNLKDKIFELQDKLEDERKKYNLLETQKQSNNDDYQYFITKLDEKRNENEELMGKIENASIQTLIDEEIKCKISEQMRFWRQKALTKEAQLKAIECRLEMDDSPIHQELLQIIKSKNKIKNAEEEQLKHHSDTNNQDKNDFEFYKLKIRSNTSIDENTCQVVNDKSVIINNSSLEKTEKKNEKKGILKSTDGEHNININVPTQTIIPFSETNQEQEKKCVTFTADTIDSKLSKKLPKQVTSKYPIIFINSDSVNEKNN